LANDEVSQEAIEDTGEELPGENNATPKEME